MLAGAPVARAQPYGIDARTTNTQLAITQLPAAPGPMRAVRVFPQLSFQRSVLLVDPIDATNRLFLVSQTGEIFVFPNKPDPAPPEVRTFLDITDRVVNSGELGCLGLAFDPEFAARPEFYVYYNATDPLRSVVSRFTLTTYTANAASAATEEVLLEVNQPYSNHNGGMIAFGPDSMLYVALGDGGSGGDPDGNGQDTTTPLGAILRIDVRGAPDPGLAYAIPPDNPFVANPPGPDSRREIYAWGLRNPYRFSFDMQNGTLYAADVGQNAWEEIDIIRSGGNYGWNVLEATHPYPPQDPLPDHPELYVPPIAEYGHSSRGSVTGGYVYYGDAAWMSPRQPTVWRRSNRQKFFSSMSPCWMSTCPAWMVTTSSMPCGPSSLVAGVDAYGHGDIQKAFELGKTVSMTTCPNPSP